MSLRVCRVITAQPGPVVLPTLIPQLLYQLGINTAISQSLRSQCLLNPQLIKQTAERSWL